MPNSMPLSENNFVASKSGSDGGAVVGDCVELEATGEQPLARGNEVLQDERDMARLGKEQLFRRDFTFAPSFAFVVLVELTWVCLLTSNTQGLIDGGRAGSFWTSIWTCLGFFPIIASLCEMASWAPTSGGQYHWVSEFAPPKIQKFLSFFTGWVSVMSWQAGTASSPLLLADMIQALVGVNQASYEYTQWRSFLIGLPIIMIVLWLNISAAHSMPLVQNMMFGLYIVGYIAIFVCILVWSPRTNFGEIFTDFDNTGGWSSVGLSMMMGQMSPLYAFLCADSAAHLSEETSDASLTVPRSMFCSFSVNSALGIVIFALFLTCLTDVSAALNDSSGYSFIWVLYHMPRAAANLLSSILIILFFGSTLAFNLSTSRQTFAFARDHGLPWSNWLGAVEKKQQIPRNALLFTAGVTVLLTLINVGSSTAFYALVSLNVATLMISYILAIGSLIWMRLTAPDSLPKARWSLGRWGLAVNTVAVLYSVFVTFWSFWPQSTPTDADDFNWSSVIFMAGVVFAVLDYHFRGRHTYRAPLLSVEPLKNA